ATENVTSATAKLAVPGRPTAITKIAVRIRRDTVIAFGRFTPRMWGMHGMMATRGCTKAPTSLHPRRFPNRFKIMSNSDFGLIGLAVMGQNLVLNVESRGFQVSVYNRTTSVTEEFVAAH